jgi:hypothetical protein
MLLRLRATYHVYVPSGRTSGIRAPFSRVRMRYGAKPTVMKDSITARQKGR